MKDRVVAKLDTTLIVVVEGSWFVIQNLEFLEQSSNSDGLARALSQGSVLGLA